MHDGRGASAAEPRSASHDCSPTLTLAINVLPSSEFCPVPPGHGGNHHGLVIWTGPSCIISVDAIARPVISCNLWSSDL